MLRRQNYAYRGPFGPQKGNSKVGSHSWLRLGQPKKKVQKMKLISPQIFFHHYMHLYMYFSEMYKSYKNITLETALL